LRRSLRMGRLRPINIDRLATASLNAHRDIDIPQQNEFYVFRAARARANELRGDHHARGAKY